MTEESVIRTLAMKWWNELPDTDKTYFASAWYNRPWQTLTGREIQAIYIVELK